VATAGSTGGLFTVQSDGSALYDPDGAHDDLAAGQTRTDQISYTVSDPFSGTATAFIVATVTGVNDAPVARDDTFAVAEGGTLSDDLQANDSDVDFADVPVVTEVNGSPANVGTTLTLPGGGLLFVNASGTFTFDTNGAYDGLGDGDTAVETVTYLIADGDGLTDGATATITVIGEQDPPVAAPDALATDEDTDLSGDVLADNGAGPDFDPDGDPVSVTEVNGVAADIAAPILLPSGARLTLNADGTFLYEPLGAFQSLPGGGADTDSFAYTLSDGTSTATGTATVTIAGLDDAPEAADDALFTDEATALADNLLVNNGFGPDADPDAGDALSIAAIDGATAAVGATITLASGALLTVQSDGDVAYDPNGAFEDTAQGDTATDSFAYTLADGAGLTDTASVTVSIAGLNDPPQARDDSFGVAIGAALSGDVLADNGSGPDSDIDGDPLSVIALNGAPGDLGAPVLLASGARVTLNGDGTFSYDQNGAFAGLPSGGSASDSFSYTLSDGLGGTATATATILISDDNLPPVARDDAITATEDAPAAGLDLLADNGAGADSDPDGDPLTVTAVNGSPANVGAQFALASGALLTVLASGAAAYDPNGAFEGLDDGETGSDSFSYTLSDGQGGTDTATVSVTISGANDAPETTDDSYSVHAGEVLTVAVGSGLLANDSDPDGDPLSVLSFQAAANGTLNLASDGSFAYAPDAGFVGVETLSYTITDGTVTETGTLTISVENAAPDARPDALATDEDTALTGNLFADNGSGPDSDPDGDPLTVSAVNGAAANVGTAVTLGSGALVTVQSDGTATYDPNGAFEALGAGDADTDSFDYTVSDGLGGFDTETVTVSIAGVDDGTVLEGTPGSDNLVAGAGDDTLIANGGGFDFLTGGPGGDVFVFNAPQGNGRDVASIMDYTPGEDLIDLAGRSISFNFELASSVQIFLDGSEFDTLIVNGAASMADLDFV
jgi:VCBS repeat-containing protein